MKTYRLIHDSVQKYVLTNMSTHVAGATTATNKTANVTTSGESSNMTGKWKPNTTKCQILQLLLTRIYVTEATRGASGA